MEIYRRLHTIAIQRIIDKKIHEINFYQSLKKQISLNIYCNICDSKNPVNWHYASHWHYTSIRDMFVCNECHHDEYDEVLKIYEPISENALIESFRSEKLYS